MTAIARLVLVVDSISWHAASETVSHSAPRLLPRCSCQLACTLRLHPVEVSHQPLASTVMFSRPFWRWYAENHKVELTDAPKCLIKHLSEETVSLKHVNSTYTKQFIDHSKLNYELLHVIIHCFFPSLFSLILRGTKWYRQVNTLILFNKDLEWDQFILYRWKPVHTAEHLILQLRGCF